jgi:hypothetical protein
MGFNPPPVTTPCKLTKRKSWSIHIRAAKRELINAINGLGTNEKQTSANHVGEREA